MNPKFLALLFVLSAAFGTNGYCAGIGGGIGNGKTGNNNNNQKPDKDPNWSSTSFADAKKSEKPVLLLVRDDKTKQHHTQKALLDLLDDGGVKAEISKFTKTEAQESATHGWKEALGGAFPTSGDERLLVIGWNNGQPAVVQTFGQDQASMKADILISAMQAAEKMSSNKPDKDKPADKK